MGGALAIALKNAGHSITELVYRSNIDGSKELFDEKGLESALIGIDQLKEINAEIILITTGDPDIATTAVQITNIAPNAKYLFHTSGSLSSDVFADVDAEGIRCGSIHPMVSVSEPKSGSEKFKGAFFCVEGEPDAAGIANEIVNDLGGRAFKIESKFKPLYHAAGVMSAGHISALVDTSIEMLENCGLSREMAKDILIPLIKSTVSNLETQDTAEALTGPYARVDQAAFERHLAAMKGLVDKEALLIYLLLTERSLAMKARISQTNGSLEELTEKVVIAKNSLK